MHINRRARRNVCLLNNVNNKSQLSVMYTKFSVYIFTINTLINCRECRCVSYKSFSIPGNIFHPLIVQLYNDKYNICYMHIHIMFSGLVLLVFRFVLSSLGHFAEIQHFICQSWTSRKIKFTNSFIARLLCVHYCSHLSPCLW